METQNQPGKHKEDKPTARVDSEDLNMEDVDLVSADVSGVTNEPVMIQNMCDVAALVHDQFEFAIPDFEEPKVEDTTPFNAKPHLLVVALLLDELETKDMIQTRADS